MEVMIKYCGLDETVEFDSCDEFFSKLKETFNLLKEDIVICPTHEDIQTCSFGEEFYLDVELKYFDVDGENLQPNVQKELEVWIFMVTERSQTQVFQHL